MKLILASASPRRAEILRNAGMEFDVLPADIDEARAPNEPVQGYVRRLAITKARIAANQLQRAGSDGRQVVIGADTAVVANGEIFGKPSSDEEARTILRQLSGRTHEVHTGLALIILANGTEQTTVEVTRVEFARLSEQEIEEYVATGEPRGKAGAYGIQGLGGRFVSRIEGCYFNVMGLPLAKLYTMLSSHLTLL